MKRTSTFTAAIFLGSSLLLGAGGAMAESCEQQVDALEAELEEAQELAISAASGGQGVAGSRQAQAQEDEPQQDEAPLEEPAVPYQEEPEEAAAIERAEDAGEGGDIFMQAKALLEEARAAAQDDDQTACRTAYEAAAALLEEHGQEEQ
jgi:hypothetical protein